MSITMEPTVTAPACQRQHFVAMARIAHGVMESLLPKAAHSETTLPKSQYSQQKRTLPRTARDRLLKATPDADSEFLLSRSAYLNSWDDHTSSTVLYLGYGSNMAAATFEGRRGIRPLSCVSVSAPTLDLTFDLPGLPYQEPCFANTALRKRVPNVPGRPPKIPPLPIPDPDPPKPTPPTRNNHGDPVWAGGLYGVVYEVTREDYAKIIATEGGGASYQDLLVPCFEIPPSVGVPEKPPIQEPPRPFLVHTLWAPQLPEKDEGSKRDDGVNGHGGDDGDYRLPEWLRALLKRVLKLSVTRPRPDPDYAQPSARYLQLLVDGAAEHDLPPDYQEWLGSLAHYKITTCRQSVGRAVSLLLAAPVILLNLLSFVFGDFLGNKQGHLPPWVVVMMGLFVRLQWKVYDRVLQPIFGDGERTEEADGPLEGVRMKRTKLQKTSTYAQVETTPLLETDHDSYV